MGWVSLILYRFTGLLCGKKLLISRTEINTDFKKLVRSRRLYSIKSMIRNNFDLKPGILRLFFWAYWIDGVLFVCSIVANSFYLFLFFVHFFNYKNFKLLGDVPKWNWIVTLILTALVILFLIRWVSDYYKLSLRGEYRDGYLKLLWLDIFTLNFLNIIGTLTFIKNKNQILNKQLNLNSQAIKDFCKIITKIEMFILLFSLIIFIIAILIGYFV